MNGGRWPARLMPVWAALVGTLVVAVTVLTIAVWAGFSLLDVRGFKSETQLSSTTLFNLVKLAFAVVAGIGGVVALVIAYRKQRLTESAELREATKLHTDRFTAATALLGDDSSAVQLASVHALAGLADDAPTRALRQTCIDVLCAYLRMPYNPDPDNLPIDADPLQVQEHATARHKYRSLREVRHTVIRIIAAHLRGAAEVPWKGHNLDFTGVVFDGGDFTGAVFTAIPAKNLYGSVSFRDAIFSGGTVTFVWSKFTGGVVDFGAAEFAEGVVDFGNAEFTGGSVNFRVAKFTDGIVNFGGAKFTDGVVDFGAAEVTGGVVDFGHAQGDVPPGLVGGEAADENDDGDPGG